MKTLTPETLFLEKMLSKMFESVRVKYSRNFSKQHKWYLKYSWSEEQEKEFKRYFIKEHFKKFKLSKRIAEKDWDWFNLCYGWTRKD